MVIPSLVRKDLKRMVGDRVSAIVGTINDGNSASRGCFQIDAVGTNSILDDTAQSGRRSDHFGVD